MPLPYKPIFLCACSAALSAAALLAAPSPSADILPNAPSHRLPMRVDKLGNSRYDNADGHDLREVPVQGDYRVPVILVEFPDCEFSASRKITPHELIQDMLNGADFSFESATGSANAFFRYTSCEQFNPIFDIYGPVKMSMDEREYVSPTEKETYIDPSGKEVAVYPAGKMISEAVKAIDADVDFSRYDSNGDGMVDFVYVFFAGQGATTGGDRNTTIWPHAFTLEAALGQALTLDGVKINRYATSSELGTNKRLSGIGTFCHEFSHVLGLPDLYDTANNGSASAVFTPGTFDTMDAGNYNNSEHTPPVFSSYERYAMEWMCPTTLTGGGQITLLPLTARNFAYKIPTRNADTEYFLLEARGAEAYDRYLEAHGLAVWHIDYKQSIWENNCPNNNAKHRHILLVEADNDLDRGTRAGDLFPGSAGICEFNADMSPSFTDWANRDTGFALSNIALNPDGTVSLRIDHSSAQDMPGISLAAPQARLCAASANTLTFEWLPVEGAEGYMISLYEADKYTPGGMIQEFLPGLYFKDLGEATRFTVESLTPGHHYEALVYAYSSLNASRTPAPIHAATQAEGFDSARTGLYPYLSPSNAGEVVLHWDEVPGALEYKLDILQPDERNIIGHASTGFDGSVLPDGWQSGAAFESREKFAGAAAPSLKFASTGTRLTSPLMESDIAAVSFAAMRHYADGDVSLDIYAEDAEGQTHLVHHITDIPAKKGPSLSFTLPVGTRRVSILYTSYSTGQNLYLDDIDLSLASDISFLPSIAEVKMYQGTSTTLQGLEPDVTYAAVITPFDGKTLGTPSRHVYFTPSSLPVHSGVQSITFPTRPMSVTVSEGVIIPSDPSMCYDLYTMQGHCIGRQLRGSHPLPAPGLYIVRIQGQSLKVVY